MKVKESREKSRKQKAKKLREMLVAIQRDPIAMKQARKLVLTT